MFDVIHLLFFLSFFLSFRNAKMTGGIDLVSQVDSQVVKEKNYRKFYAIS